MAPPQPKGDKMDPVSAMAIGGVANMAGGVIGSAIQQHSARQIQAHEHRWQEKMRATAYQTTVNDLEKAGLNPALAYMNGSASAGVGSGTASAPMPDTNPHIDPVSALTARKEQQLLDEQRKNVKEDTKSKQIENKINSLTIPSAENKANSDKTKWGKYIRPYLNDAGTIIDGVSRLAMPFAGATTAKRAINAIGKARPTVQNNYYSK